MLRSPFFYFFIFLLFTSCKKKTDALIPPDYSRKETIKLQQKAAEEFQKSHYNSSFYYFNKSKIAFEYLKDSTSVAYNLIQMANIQQINGDYYGSKETLTEALPYVKNDNNFKSAINNLFGIADKELAIYDDAIFYYNQAIKDSKDQLTKQSPLNNIAVLYIKQKKYDKAIVILKGILKTKEFDTFLKSKARVIDNLGFAYFKKGSNEKGLQLMLESLKLRKQINDSYGSIVSYTRLAEYYAKTDNKTSNQYAKKAYEIATQLNSVDERLEALSLLISNNAGLQYAQNYITINDSIIKVRNNFKNKFAKIKYDSKKEKDENQKLRLKNAENQLSIQRGQYQQYLFIIISLFLGVLIFYLRKYYRNKNRTEKLQTAYDTETRIAKDIHDELANDVFNTITFTQTQPLEIESTRETLVQKLDHIYARVRGISKENNSIDIKTNYALHLKEMLSTYNSENRNVIINNIEKVNWDLIEEIKKVTIYRVLQELMVNMKKHSEALVVVVKFGGDGKTIFIDYTDNGKGTQKDKIVKNGLLNMENRILSSKGTITFDTEPDKGFRVKITMPK